MDNKEIIDQRRAYVDAFNSTMVRMLKERLVLLDVVDTGALYSSIEQMRAVVDGEVTTVSLSFGFLTYGLYQDRGTGREVARGNAGDIGREKKRQKRPWLSKAYYSSLMNLKEFFEESLGKQFEAIAGNIK